MIKQGLRWWLVLLLLLAVAAIAAGLFIQDELLWGLGLGFLLFFMMLVPVIAMRARRLGRVDQTPALATWRYTPDEARQVARDLLAWQRQRNRWLVPFTAGCLALLGGVFAVILHLEFPDRPLWQWLLLVVPAGLPWVVRGAYHGYLRHRIKRAPCETRIGRHFLIWGNVRPVFNERDTLVVTAADYLSENGRHYLKVCYHSTERMRYGKAEFDDWVLLLIPAGHESEARALLTIIGDQSEQS
ncbi:hypothetical protein [Acetobacterium wieringae]|uniref:hypothetical protein n=1 Tax=Acetobacterium wieringae TaxID=52694 RepID=UPI0026F37239|nr:hypothetical protein [Acetobacterium wieringae]